MLARPTFRPAAIMAALLAFAAGCGKRATAHAGLFLVVIVIRFGLTVVVELEHGVDADFQTRCGIEAPWGPTATSRCCSWLGSSPSTAT